MKQLLAALFVILSGAAHAASFTIPAFTLTGDSGGSAVVSQVHNAPGWLPGHAYAPASGPFTRVNSGLGWSPASGTWNPGQALAAYQLTSGACTSGTTMPTGMGATIQDGTCAWKWLSVTDYISITGWAYDNQAWVAGSYNPFDIVTSGSPLQAYMQTAVSCSSTTPPGLASSDGCQWQYLADVLYSSKKSYIPTQTHDAVKGVEVIHKSGNYVGQLWNDRQYVAGQNGESSPISIRNHDSYSGEGQTLSCPTAGCGRIIITTAPGESFAATIKPTDPLTGYDPTKGVSILIEDSIRWPTTPDGLFIENNVDIIGLQIKSLHGGAVGNASQSYDNGVTVQYCICEGGIFDNQFSTPAVVSLDTSSAVSNSLLISHSPHAIIFKYSGLSLHNTIVNPEGTGLAAIETGARWIFNDTTVADTAIFGFAHAGAFLEAGTAFSPTSANNVTDAPIGDSGVTEWNGSTPADGTVAVIPGTVYGSSLVAAFMGAGDYRPKPGGPLAGRGAAYGNFVSFCASPYTDCGVVNYSFDTPDLIGTARPGSDGYDIGAWQSP